MATINIDSQLRKANDNDKLWWHGTSSWHIDKIKKEGLSEEVECRAWDCEKGIYFDKDAGMSGGMWARNAVQSAARQGISGKGYPRGTFRDYFARQVQSMAEFGELDDEDAEAHLGMPVKDLKSPDEYEADEQQWLDNMAKIDKILLVMDEDQIPEDCTRRYNGHWKAVSGWGQGVANEKYLRNPDGTAKLESPYGVDGIPDLTDEQQQAMITQIEQELILNNCKVPTNRFYACNIQETGLFNAMIMMRKEQANEAALEG